jgi:hypothetical protein
VGETANFIFLLDKKLLVAVMGGSIERVCGLATKEEDSLR